MTHKHWAVPILALALMVSAPAAAQTVSTLVEGNIGGVITSDPQGPSASTVTSFLDFPPNTTVYDALRDALGGASQNPGGVGAVRADGVFYNGLGSNSILASANWEDTATNGTAGPVNYSFDFVIEPPALRLADYFGYADSDPDAPVVTFSATIRVNGALAFEATAEMVGGTISHVLTETGTSFSPVFVPGTNVFGYDFSGYSDTLDLGAVASGGSVTVEYEMVATVAAAGFESGGRANFGDPFDLGGSPGFTGSLTPSGPVSTDGSSVGQMKGRFER